jgi:hypothetical protein
VGFYFAQHIPPEEIVESVTYKSNPFTPDEIIQRAEECVAQNKIPHVYNLFGNDSVMVIYSLFPWKTDVHTALDLIICVHAFMF